jgi:translocation and assembly module TamB
VKGTFNFKKASVRIAKIIGWTFFSVVLLLIVVILLIQVPAVQNKITQKVIASLQEKIKTPVRIKRLYISFPKKIVLEEFYLEDQAEDTLVYVGSLSVNTNLLGLLKNRVEITEIESEDLDIRINRQQDSVFNFDYITKALAGDSSETQEPDTLSKPWIISLDELILKETQLSFHDILTGIFANARIGNFAVDMDKFDLEKSIYHIDNISVKDFQTDVLQTKLVQVEDSVKIDSTETATPLDFDFGEIQLNNIKATYTHQISGQKAQLNLGDILVVANKIDLQKHIVNLQKVSMSNSFISYHQLDHGSEIKTKSTAIKDTANVETEQPWKVSLNDLQLLGNSFQYYDFRTPMFTKGIDFNHLWFSRFELRGKDFELDGFAAKGQVENLSLYDKSGLTINSFKTSFNLKENSLKVSDFTLDTPSSYIHLNGGATFESLANMATNYSSAIIDFNLISSTLGLRDVLFFQPNVLDSIPFHISKSTSLRAEAKLSGRVDRLSIDHFLLQVLDSTELKFHGSVRGLPDFTKAFANINLERFYIPDQDLKKILPDSLLSATFELPKRIELNGTFNGTMTAPSVNANLKLDQGLINLIARMNLDSTVRENYDAKLSVKDLQVGKMVGDTTLGNLSLNASIHGAGLRIDNLNAVFETVVNDFTYKGYTYTDFRLKGSINNYFFSGLASLQDENLDMKLEGDFDYNQAVPRYKFVFDLKNIDMHALNLTDRDLRARGVLNVDLATSDFKLINGNLGIRNFGVYNGKELYTIDSLLFVSIDQEGQSEIDIQSDIINGNFKGTINLYSLPSVLRRHFNNYFYLHDPPYEKTAGVQNFKFDLVLKNTDLITEVLLPEMEPFIPGEVKGEFNSEEAKLNLDFGISKIKYGSIGVDSIRLHIDSDKEALKYSFSMRQLGMDTLTIHRLGLSGKVERDSILTKFALLDSVEKEKYVFGGVINSYMDAYQLRFSKDELIVNYKNWNAPEDHYILLSETGLWPFHFELAHEDQKISIKRDQSLVSILLTKLQLSDVTSLVEGATPVGGMTDGKIAIVSGANNSFDSRLDIKEFTILEQTWGDLALRINKKLNTPMVLDLGVKGEKVTLRVNGQYQLDAEVPTLDLNADLSNINLEALQPLALGLMKKMEGALTGQMKITGEASKPDINGFVDFKKTAFVPKALNSRFEIDNEKLQINHTGITFNNFEIRDQKNNTALLKGTITNQDFQTFGLNLDLAAKNFQLLNSTAADNSLFYGNVGVTSNMRIRGTSNQPKINMEVSLRDGSDFTFAVPQSEKGVQDQKGIVEFVDKDALTDPFLAQVKPSDSLSAAFLGIDLNANIELTDKETFNIVIDPATGDKLTVKGKSTLSFSMDPSGDQQLSGRYEITSGSYDFSFYKLAKRNFSIDKGSSISWTGDPMKADLDIRAIYQVETSPMELVSNQLTTTNQQEINRYKQRLPFLVYMQIKGELSTPEISFKLNMPQDKQNAFGGSIYAMLMDLNTRESDLNKQVFALLVLKRFIAENPLQSEGGGDIGSSARTSVSKILTDQLNKLSDKVKGVQLSFDVKSYDDYSTGTDKGQTQLQLGVSKSLFDQRLVVKVSGNVDVEGENAGNQHSVTDYIGDLALEYKLTEDGRFRITGFRNSNYDMIDGELIQTGAGLIYIKDYNTLSELFKTDEKDN